MAIIRRRKITNSDENNGRGGVPEQPQNELGLIVPQGLPDFSPRAPEADLPPVDPVVPREMRSQPMSASNPGQGGSGRGGQSGRGQPGQGYSGGQGSGGHGHSKRAHKRRLRVELIKENGEGDGGRPGDPRGGGIGHAVDPTETNGADRLPPDRAGVERGDEAPAGGVAAEGREKIHINDLTPMGMPELRALATKGVNHESCPR